MRRLLQFLTAAALVFTANNSVAQIYEMDAVNGMTINTCSGTFFDSQALDLVPGSGDYYYDIGETYQVTFCSNIAGSAIRVDFSFIQAVAGEDTLWVYDGSSATGTPLAVYSGGYGSTSVVGYSGCLTFVFISTGTYVSTGWEGVISCFNYPPVPLQPACTNVGFESGNFSGWYGTYGIPVVSPATGPTPISIGAPGAAHPVYYPDVYGATSSPYQTITTGAGVDPFGGFPVVSPTGGTNSMMLGDGTAAGYGGASIEQKFNVTAANATMVYSYAVVIQDAAAGGTPHASEEQPFFKIEAFDCSGNPIPCGDYLVVGGPSIPGFTLAPGTVDIYYKDWTDVFLDLTPYIGSCVTVRFTQGDCALGAHFSYVYIDAMCAPLEITGPQWICPGDSTTLVAPTGGASYAWTPGGETTQTITVSPASLTNYSCTVTSVAGPTCTSVAYYWVDVYPPASVDVAPDTICDGASAALTAVPGVPGGNYLWSPGGQTTSNISVSPSVTTNYTVTYTDLNGCSVDSMTTVVVDPVPVVNPVTNQTLCNSANTTAINFTSATPGTTFDWTNNDPSIGLAASGTGNIASFTATNAGTTPVVATITVTPTAGGCPGLPIDFTITVNPTPAVDVVTDQLVCNNANTSAINFTGPTAGTTYDWTNSTTSIGLAGSGTGNIAAFTAINTGATQVVATITVTPTANGCQGTPIDFTITVDPSPVVDPILNQTLCNTDATAAVNFTSTTPGTTFDWTNSAMSIGLAASGTGNIASFTATNTGTAPVVATISVTPTANGCVGTPVDFTITVNPTPVVDPVTNQALCNNDATTAINFTSSTAGTTYAWTNNDPSIGLAASGTGNIASFTATNAGTAPVTATISVTPTANGCQGVPVDFTITVNPTPVVDPITNQVVCNNASTTTANFTSATAGTTFTWTNSAPSIGLAASGTGNSIPAFTATNSGSTPVVATISVTPTANGCTGTPVDFTITVNPSPTPVITGTLTYCTGDSSILSTTTPYTSYLWSDGSTTASSGFTIADNPITVQVTDANGCVGISPAVNVVENTAMDYYSSVEICQGDSVLLHGNWESTSGLYIQTYVLPTGCDSIANVTLTVNPLPVIDAGIDQMECDGVPITLTATGAPVIDWTPASITNGVPFTPGVGSYTYIATGTDANGCQNSDTVNVIISPLPTVDPITDDEVCAGDMTAGVVFTGVIPGTTYDWVNTDPSIGLAASGTGDILSFAGVNGGATPSVATITVTPSIGVCVGSPVDFTITVNPLPVVDAGNDLIACEGDAITLTASGANTYVWDNGVTNGVSFVPITSGTYTVIGTDANGCQGTDDVNVVVEPLPNVMLSSDITTGCAPLTVTFYNQTSSPMTNCVWKFGGGLVATGCDSVTVTFWTGGYYDVTLTTTSANGCTNSLTLSDYIYVEEAPIAAFLPSPNVLSVLNPTVHFYNHSTGASSYEWDFGDTSFGSSEVNPTHVYADDTPGSYIVELVAISSMGCTDTAWHTIIVEDELIFYVPNTFTPDDDDYNQLFYPVFYSGYDPYNYHMLIFNRWGEIVWESYDLNAGWDGTYAGRYVVQDGTYTWKMEFKTTLSDERKMVVGHVNVIK